MYINYFPGANGIVYASLVSSVRKGRRVVRGDDSVYLGRVLDKDRLIFKNRADGIFALDPATFEKVKAPADFVPDTPRKNAKLPERYLDFGDVFFLKSFVEKRKLNQMVDAIECDNPDSLMGLLCYYVLTGTANCLAATWQEGSIAGVYYAKANLTPQSIDDMLAAIGTEAKVRSFFRACLPFIREWSNPLGGAQEEEIAGSLATEVDEAFPKRGDYFLIDCAGFPDSIRIPITAVGSRNGQVSEEVRLNCVVQKGTWLPIGMNCTPGCAADASALLAAMRELKAQKVDVKLAILDAGYMTERNLKDLLESKIPFISMLSDDRKLFKQIVKEESETLACEENLVRCGESLFYLKRVEREIYEGQTASVYLGLDLAEEHRLRTEVVRCAQADHLSIQEVRRLLRGKGVFCLVSSRQMTADKVLPLCSMLQEAEQVFGIKRHSDLMRPLCVQNEDVFRGHLLLTLLAAAIRRVIQREAEARQWSLEELFASLRNHKCKVSPKMVLPQEAGRKQMEIYKAFGLKVPKSFAVDLREITS